MSDNKMFDNKIPEKNISGKTLYAERKQKVYSFICADFYKPMKIKEIAIMLEVSAADRPDLEQILAELQEEGKIVLSKRGKYSKAEASVFTGQFKAHPKGFGFVILPDQEQDIYIAPDKTNGALQDDTVTVSVVPGPEGKRREGVILEIKERGIKQVVCRYEASRNYGFAVPDNNRFLSDIFIPAGDTLQAQDGQKVLVEITDYGNKGKNPAGKVVEILGFPEDPGVDVLSIAKGYNLPMIFPERVINQADRADKPVTEADMAGRSDFRDLMTITIDGDDSKDFDDAVSLEMDGENYILGVHIADVTNYVQEHSALDEEAKERGTSVYLADRVIPMLPFALSNGICSLNEGQERLTLSCMMTIDPQGVIIDHTIVESVIVSKHRMTYSNVKKILEGESEELSLTYADILPMLQNMAKLSGILRQRRQKRGGIDFDFPETMVILDSKGNPTDILPHERNAATKLIEDFMLAANETVAEEYFWQEIPFVYRTHDTPDAEKVEALAQCVRNFGYILRTGREEVHPKEFQKLIASVRGKEEEGFLSRMTLRSMKQARYTTECTGHFGLAAKYYCHFTSPIRRYPDLQIHRIIKENIRGRLQEERIDHYRQILPEVAKHSSETERRAEEAERETVKLKKVEYMEKHMGEHFDGVISGVAEYGFFVELENTVEGLVRVNSLLDDFYIYHAESFELTGRDTGKSYRMGQKVAVRVIGCDRFQRTVDFELL